MGQIKVKKNVGSIEDLCIIMSAVHGDNRGYFILWKHISSVIWLKQV